RLTWADVEWLMNTTKLPVGLKGIMTVRDARRAVDMGVRLIWVSNHGGRQLDHTQSTIEALPPIVDAVAGRAEIVVDGGFSRGTDVVKALARGAKMVAIGRTVLWGLAADGAAGVARGRGGPHAGSARARFRRPGPRQDDRQGPLRADEGGGRRLRGSRGGGVQGQLERRRDRDRRRRRGGRLALEAVGPRAVYTEIQG